MSKKLPTEIQMAEAIAHYPEQLREHVIWLRSYLHRRADDNIWTLCEHARQKGFNNSYNYFYQILSGRYFKVNEEGKVQGGIPSFLSLCANLKVYDTFANTLAKIRFVETSVFNEINSYIARKSAAFNACRFGAIIGHTGLGKSASFKEIERKARPGTIIHIEAPAEPILGQFVHKIAHRFGATISERLASKRNRILEKLHEGHIIIIDNVQRCYDPRRGVTQPIFNYIQELQDDTNCTVILSWTPVATQFQEEMSNAYFEQFVGRIGGEREILRLDDYPCDEDIELICQSFKLTDADIEKIMHRLRAVVREKGRIRSLFNILQRGSRLAIAKKAEFSAEHIFRALGD